jgi:flagellar basal body-associated protein FliL
MKEQRNILDDLKAKKIAIPDEAFFKSLAARVTQDSVPKKSAKVIPLVAVVLSAAAALVLLFWIFGSKSLNDSINEGTISFASLEDEEILEYVETNIDDFEEDEISALVVFSVKDSIGRVVNERNDQNFSVELDEMFSGLSDEDIMTFLKDEPTEEDEELVSIF